MTQTRRQNIRIATATTSSSPRHHRQLPQVIELPRRYHLRQPCPMQMPSARTLVKQLRVPLPSHQALVTRMLQSPVCESQLSSPPSSRSECVDVQQCVHLEFSVSIQAGELRRQSHSHTSSDTPICIRDCTRRLWVNRIRGGREGRPIQAQQDQTNQTQDSLCMSGVYPNSRK